MRAWWLVTVGPEQWVCPDKDLEQFRASFPGGPRVHVIGRAGHRMGDVCSHPMPFAEVQARLSAAEVEAEAQAEDTSDIPRRSRRRASS